MNTNLAPQRSHYDVVIVGARVAGAATAMLLARAGLDVLVVDRSHYGADTLSTHLLMRAGLWQLHRWGLLPSIVEADTPEITATSFHYGEDAVHLPITGEGPVGGLYAPRRTLLDPVLADAACRAGAEVVHGARVTGLLRSRQSRVTGVTIRVRDTTLEVEADLVVGADGLNSTVAQTVRAPIYRQGNHAAAAIYTYVAGVSDAGYDNYFTPGIAAGTIPTNSGLVCVFVSLPPERFAAEARGAVPMAWHSVLHEVNPAAAHRIRRGEIAAPFRSFPGRPGFFRTSHGPGWALVGDAGHYNDSLTAHGMTGALRDAELLAAAVLADDLPTYQQARDVLAAPIYTLTDQIASLAWSLEDLQAYHIDLSRAYKREAQTVAAWSSTAQGWDLAQSA